MTKAIRQTRTPRIPLAAHTSQSRRGSLALGLINTEVVERGQRRDLLPSPDALARWWAGACERYPDECLGEGAEISVAWTEELLEVVKALRTGLRMLVTDVVEHRAITEEDLKPVNKILAQGYLALESKGQGTVEAVMRSHNPKMGTMLIAIAQSALRLVTASDWQRLHQCKSDRCIVFFYDTTKSGTRRWCSTGCMNRARSISHYHLAKMQPRRNDA